MSQLDIIVLEIENTRMQLRNLIDERAVLTDSEVVKTSQKLDKQIDIYLNLVSINKNIE